MVFACASMQVEDILSAKLQKVIANQTGPSKVFFGLVCSSIDQHSRL